MLNRAMTSQVITQQWLKKPKQVRSQKTLERILSVAEELISSGTFDRVTVAGIVKLAGTSVGAFYARFSDKEALRHVLQERFVWRAEAAVNEVTELSRWVDRPLVEVVHGVVVGLADLLRLERGGFLSLVTGWRLRGQPEARERSARIDELVSDRVETLLLERKYEIAHPRPELAIRVGLSMVLWTLREHLVFGAPGPGPGGVVDDDLVAELGAAYLAYLQGCA